MELDNILVTGVGAVSGFGANVEDTFNKIYNGECCITKMENPEKDYKVEAKDKVKVASVIQNFPNEKWQKTVIGKKIARFVSLGLEACSQALEDACLLRDDFRTDPNMKIGVVVGSGIGGINEICDGYKTLIQTGKTSPFFIPTILINLLPGHIAIQYGVQGPNQSQVAACATGAAAIVDGARMIRDGICDVVIVGAAEASLCDLCVAGFYSLKALTYNEDPATASRPFDATRSGFVLGEGAGILILESEKHAQKRGVKKAYAKFVGAGLTCDAYNMVAPDPDGSLIIKAMEQASTSISKDKIGYINAHATSTSVGDAIELKAIKSVFGNYWKDISVSSIKGATGHMLGAAGSFEAIMTVLSLYKDMVLPTINLQQPDKEALQDSVLVDLIPNKGRAKKIEYALTNSFGFGGHNISILFGKA